MFARTPRLLLRPGFPEDAPALAAVMSDAAIARNLAVVPWPYRLRDAEAPGDVGRHDPVGPRPDQLLLGGMVVRAGDDKNLVVEQAGAEDDGGPVHVSEPGSSRRPRGARRPLAA